MNALPAPSGFRYSVCVCGGGLYAFGDRLFLNIIDWMLLLVENVYVENVILSRWFEKLFIHVGRRRTAGLGLSGSLKIVIIANR